MSRSTRRTGTVTLRALFRNPNTVLLPGMFVRARVEEGVTQDAILVPQAGVTHDTDRQATAFVVDPDDKVALRPCSSAEHTRTSGSSKAAWPTVNGSS